MKQFILITFAVVFSFTTARANDVVHNCVSGIRKAQIKKLEKVVFDSTPAAGKAAAQLAEIYMHGRFYKLDEHFKKDVPKIEACSPDKSEFGLLVNNEGPSNTFGQTIINKKRALELIMIGVQIHDGQALNMLGDVYYDGSSGLPKNLTLAQEKYLSSAKAGYALGQLNVGAMYAGVSETPKIDFVLGYAWLNLAANAKDDFVKQTAVKYRNIVSTKMSRSQIIDAEQVSTKCFETRGGDCEPTSFTKKFDSLWKSWVR